MISHRSEERRNFQYQYFNIFYVISDMCFHVVRVYFMFWYVDSKCFMLGMLCFFYHDTLWEFLSVVAQALMYVMFDGFGFGLRTQLGIQRVAVFAE